ncbi:MAG: hypothetical protein DIZ78_07220 [endosymbiont of Escarpia spicata]|uniref:Phosphate ABC transporter substrate-binding protein n=1 Tax=endosymbiont of Escarpia spicata TaxID=2200908 RepID=A0A370DP39_9GAMM|nr:MAG: hypothetical protein DIZ78_07220 [endosymbiont of Escarpia spicata]
MSRIHLPFALCARLFWTAVSSTLALSLFVSVAAAEEVLIVVQQDTEVTTLTREEASNLFLGLGSTNSRLIPFDRSEQPLRERFYREVIGLSAASVRAHWAKQVFTGRGRPPARVSKTDVTQVLKDKPGAVTYVAIDQLPAHSRVLLSTEQGEQE